MNRLISETKRLAMEGTELEKEVGNLMGQLTLQEMHLEMVNKDLDASSRENNLLKALLDSILDHDATISLSGSTVKQSVLMLFYLRKYIERTQPTEEDQLSKEEDMKLQYEQLLRLYEMNPTYKSIVETECYSQELSSLLLQHRNKAMQLEAALKL